jgi:hypothetical protein
LAPLSSPTIGIVHGESNVNIQRYRKQQLSTLTNEKGVYALCDLDNVPIYIGQSTDGIRSRVQRHLTSARSDVIANRLLDVWEVAYVWAWPIPSSTKEKIDQIENYLISYYHSQKPLMNGTIPESTISNPQLPELQQVQVLPEEEIHLRKDPIRRLPRQAEQFGSLFSHILEVKDNAEQRRTLVAHFERLRAYYEDFLKSSEAQG